MTADNSNDLGKILKQRRVMIPMTLGELAAASGVSSSHLGRIERGERFPSAHMLRKIAKPLGFEETELLTLGGFLSPQPSAEVDQAQCWASRSLRGLSVITRAGGGTACRDDNPHRYKEHGQMPPQVT